METNTVERRRTTRQFRVIAMEIIDARERRLALARVKVGEIRGLCSQNPEMRDVLAPIIEWLDNEIVEHEDARRRAKELLSALQEELRAAGLTV